MSRLERYMDDLRRALRRLPRDERDAVLGEIRSHLRNRIDDAVAGGATVSAATRDAIAAFGGPEEIAVQYKRGGTVVKDASGTAVLDVAMRTGAAAGRGLGNLAKGVFYITLALIGLAGIVAVGALIFADGILDRFEDDIRENVPHPLYRYSDSWVGNTARHSEVATDRFQVRDDVKEFWFEVSIDPAGQPVASGCARVVLQAPDGTLAYDSGTDCGQEQRSLTLNQPGSWQVQYQFFAYEGSVDVSAYYFERARPDT